jgi:hypothetical protein
VASSESCRDFLPPRIEIAERFIHQKYLGVDGNGRQGDTLLLAAGGSVAERSAKSSSWTR